MICIKPLAPAGEVSQGEIEEPLFLPHGMSVADANENVGVIVRQFVLFLRIMVNG